MLYSHSSISLCQILVQIPQEEKHFQVISKHNPTKCLVFFVLVSASKCSFQSLGLKLSMYFPPKYYF